MNTRSLAIQFTLLCYFLLSWNKFYEIKASIVSLCSYSLLTLTDFASPARYWREDLMEFWIAGIVWVLGGAFLVRMLITRTKKHPNKKVTFQSAAPVFLVFLALIALTAPFIAPVGPNIQGSLATARLLPPLSKATIIESAEYDTLSGDGRWLAQASKQANQYLLERTITFSCDEHFALPQTSNEVKTGSILFLFGTDDNARDVFSRIVFGARISLAIGLIAAIVSVFIGTLVGFAAGYSNRIVDSFIMRLTDLALSIPSLFLVLAIMAFLGKSVLTLILVLSLTGWMGIARTVRTEVLRLRDKEFVLAAKLLNQPTLKILKNHILRNLKSLLVIAATLQFGSAVLAEASLSFLGLGIQPPLASWGNMLGQSLNYLHRGWWLGLFPGVLLTLVLIASHYAVEKTERTAK